MDIVPNDVLFVTGGLLYEKDRFGAGALRRATIARGGEELREGLLRASPGRYYDRDGFVRIATNDVLRPWWYDVNGDGVKECYLLTEPAAINGILQSEDFSTTWGRNGIASIGANADAAPDGSVTADRLVEDGTNTNHGVSQVRTITSNANFLVAVSGKVGPRIWLRFKVHDGTSAQVVNRWFNLSTGAKGSGSVVGTGTEISSGVFVEANGFFRCYLIANLASALTSATIEVQMATADVGGAYAGDGVSYLSVWGFQFVDNTSVYSSYVAPATGAGAQTRAVDKASFTVPNLQGIQSVCFYWRGREMGELANALSGNRIFNVASVNPRLIVRGGVSGGGKMSAQFFNAAGGIAQQEQAIAGLTVGDDLELMIALAIAGVYPNQVATVRTDYARNGGAPTTGTTSPSAAVDALLYNTGLLFLGSGDINGGAASVSAHRLLCAARGAGFTIPDFRRYWGL